MKYCAKCKSAIYKNMLQNCFNTVPFSDNRFELNGGLKRIVEMTRLYQSRTDTKLLNCQEAICSVERSFSMLHKLLAKNAISGQIMSGNI